MCAAAITTQTGRPKAISHPIPISTDKPAVTIWAASLSGGAPVKIAEGDAPAISARGVLAYVANDQVWTAPLNGKGKAERLFFDRGKDSDLRWSPDGTKLAFVSGRGDHAFIGVYTSKDRPILYLSPSTNNDIEPRWSRDSKSIAFARLQGDGGPPDPWLVQIPHPWSIRVADAATGNGHIVWQSPDTLSGSWPDVEGGANLHWAAGNRLVFRLLPRQLAASLLRAGRWRRAAPAHARQLHGGTYRREPRRQFLRL